MSSFSPRQFQVAVHHGNQKIINCFISWFAFCTRHTFSSVSYSLLLQERHESKYLRWCWKSCVFNSQLPSIHFFRLAHFQRIYFSCSISLNFTSVSANKLNEIVQHIQLPSHHKASHYHSLSSSRSSIYFHIFSLLYSFVFLILSCIVFVAWMRCIWLDKSVCINHAAQSFYVDFTHSAFYISFLFSIFRRSVSSTMPFSGCRSLHLYSTYEKNKNDEQQQQNQLQRIWWIIVRANRMRWNFINSDMHTIIPTDNWQAEIKTNKQTENKLNNHIILGWKMFVPLRHILIKCVGRVWAIFICSCCAMANNMCST